MKKIVVLDGYALNPGDLDWNVLTQINGQIIADLVVYDRTPADLVIERAIDADIVVFNKVTMSADVIRQLPKLKVLAITATGTNNIDFAQAKKQGVEVRNVAGYSTDAVAQQVFALLLALTNKVYPHHQSVQALQWTNGPDFCYFLSPWSELAQKTLGIYGLGDIGRKVATIGLAFGMKVIGFNRSDNNLGLPIEMVSATSLLQRSDILSLHAPLTPDTEHFINQQSLNIMKPSALLINTARGALIDEQALAFALKNNFIAGAGIDVLKEEPPKAGNPLFGLANCLITPHIAWTSTEARTTLLHRTAENIRPFLTV